ncbi:MAG TPA: hypothetical protein VEB20_10115 [Azospirillaceae bacterium]|nr:hypothetical protein [Azospirillaceae bacterium]
MTMTSMETAPPSGGPGAGAQADGQEASRSTHFVFDGKVFQLPGGYFSLAKDTGEPVFNVNMGDVWGKIPFRALRDAFHIDDSGPDAELLAKVEKGLRFVKEIRPGDSIPREILDGTASWSVDERHLAIARGRITLQLISWITGRETVVTDRGQLEQMMEDPQTKQRAQQAFAELAKRFGLPEDRKQEVVDKVDSVVRELSYIEALRDRYGQVQRILSGLAQINRIYKADRQITSDISRMVALMKNPISMFDDIFAQLDGQTAEVLGMLRAYDASVAFIRRMRDELHTNLMIWDEMIAAWSALEIDRSVEVEQMLKRTYQFLAQNFLIAKVWQRG